MANSKFQDQINKSCSGNNWDQGNDTHAPTDQAMSGGVSTVKQKCNAATNEEQEDDDMAETYGGTSMGAGTRMQAGGSQMGAQAGGYSGSTGAGGQGGMNATQTHGGEHGDQASSGQSGGQVGFASSVGPTGFDTREKAGGTQVTDTWKDSTIGGNSTPQDAGGHDRNGSQTMQGGGPEYTENHDGPFYGGTDDPETGGRGVQTGGAGASSTWREPSSQGPESPTMTGFTGDPTESGQVNSENRNTVASLKGQTTATAEQVEPKVQNAANDARVKAENAANDAQLRAENAANTAKRKAENAANTTQGKVENAANTVGAKAGGVMDAMKNGAENFFNVDFDGDGKVGNGAFGAEDKSGLQDPELLQDPDLAYSQRASMASEPNRRATTAVAV